MTNSDIRRYTILTKKVTVASSTKPNTPDFSYKNPRNKDIKIFELSLIPDPTNFKANGQIYSDVDNWTLLDINAGDLQDISSLDGLIPEKGFTFPKDSLIRFFGWNPTNGTGRYTLFIAIGED